MIALILLFGCAKDAPQDSASELCQDAPLTTYDNFGQGFMLQHCQSCHASESLERNGAPEAVHFDDEEAVWQHADRILTRSTGDAPDMPPMGGVTSEDRLRLEQWLLCE
ncbi:MAG: hypothetical protein VX899_19000 [Myxococcota bacterium]|nr:hypothetical protein [Myxococcota bacterium]